MKKWLNISEKEGKIKWAFTVTPGVKGSSMDISPAKAKKIIDSPSTRQDGRQWWDAGHRYTMYEYFTEDGLSGLSGWQGTRADFAKQYGPEIVKQAKGTGLFPEIVLSQAFIEGSDANGVMGNGPPMLAGNNVFAIEDPATGKFKTYNSIEDSIEDYFNFMQSNANYKTAGVFTAATPAVQASAIQAAGYAGSDTSYGAKLTALAVDSKALLDTVTGGAMDNDMLVAGTVALSAITLAAIFWPGKSKQLAGLAMNTAEKVGASIAVPAIIIAGAVGIYLYEDKDFEIVRDQDGNIEWGQTIEEAWNALGFKPGNVDTGGNQNLQLPPAKPAMTPAQLKTTAKDVAPVTPQNPADLSPPEPWQ